MLYNKEYTLTTAWDVTSATNTANSSSLESDENNLNIQFHSDGIMYLGGNGGDDINKYTLSTPWDISTLNYHRRIHSVLKLRI